MKLKNATLLAIIGVSILAVLRVYAIINILDMAKLYAAIIVQEGISGIALMLLLPFLIILYKNQK